MRKLAVVARLGFVILAVAIGVVSTTPIPADALPIYARQTGLPCGQCHVNPAGGGPRTAFGKAFAANGHRLPGGRQRYERNHGRNYGYGPGMMGGYGYGPGMMGRYGPGMMGGYGR